MPEATLDALLLAAAVIVATAGLGWFALAMDAHWQQACGTVQLPPSMRRALRVLGSAALILSLVLCLLADHPTMAAIVWVMALAAGALAVAFALSWRPRVLGLLLAGVRPARPD